MATEWFDGIEVAGRTPQECVDRNNASFTEHGVVIGVALHRSAWIEIGLVRLKLMYLTVALHRSAWIEI